MRTSEGIRTECKGNVGETKEGCLGCLCVRVRDETLVEKLLNPFESNVLVLRGCFSFGAGVSRVTWLFLHVSFWTARQSFYR